MLEAALELIAERGFDGASIRHIAERAGLRSASLYDLFPGRAHIPAPGPALAALGSMCLRVPHWFVPSEAFTAEQLADQYAEVALRVLDHDPPSVVTADRDRGSPGAPTRSACR